MSLRPARLRLLRPEEPWTPRWDLGARPQSEFRLLQCLCLLERWRGTVPSELVWVSWPLLWDLLRVRLLVLCRCLEESESSHWCLSLLPEGVSCWDLGVCLSSAFQLLQHLCLAEWSWEPVRVSWSLQEDLPCRLSRLWERSLPLLHLRWPRDRSRWLHDLWDLRRDRLPREEAGTSHSNLGARPSPCVSSQALLCCHHLLLGESLPWLCRDRQQPRRGRLVDLLRLLSRGLPCPKRPEQLRGCRAERPRHLRLLSYTRSCTSWYRATCWG